MKIFLGILLVIAVIGIIANAFYSMINYQPSNDTDDKIEEFWRNPR